MSDLTDSREVYLGICKEQHLKIDSPESYEFFFNTLYLVQRAQSAKVSRLTALLKWVQEQEDLPERVKNGIQTGLEKIGNIK